VLNTQHSTSGLRSVVGVDCPYFGTLSIIHYVVFGTKLLSQCGCHYHNVVNCRDVVVTMLLVVTMLSVVTILLVVTMLSVVTMLLSLS